MPQMAPILWAPLFLSMMTLLFMTKTQIFWANSLSLSLLSKSPKTLIVLPWLW